MQHWSLHLLHCTDGCIIGSMTSKLRPVLLHVQVFDNGLLGEGVLHMLAAARQKLLTKDATLVPAAATVYCQPLQMRVGQVAGFDMQQANRWQWRPDYEGIHLNLCRSGLTSSLSLPAGTRKYTEDCTGAFIPTTAGQF